MSRLPLLLTIAVLTAVAAPAASAADGEVAPPGGDAYMNPVALSDLADPAPLPADTGFEADTSNYTLQADMYHPPRSGGPKEPRKCGDTTFSKTIWSVFHADRDGVVTIKTSGDFDAVIGFVPFRDPQEDVTPHLDEAVCIDESPSHEEQMPVKVEAGHWYAIQVGGTGKPAGGHVQVRLHFELPPETLQMSLGIVRRSSSAAGTTLRKLILARKARKGAPIGPDPRGAKVELRCKRGCRSKTFALEGDAIRIRYLEGRLLRPRTKFVVRVTRRRPRARGPEWTVSVDRHGKLHVSHPRLVGG
jgi:hypothetical protein